MNPETILQMNRVSGEYKTTFFEEEHTHYFRILLILKKHCQSSENLFMKHLSFWSRALPINLRKESNGSVIIFYIILLYTILYTVIKSYNVLLYNNILREAYFYII